MMLYRFDPKAKQPLIPWQTPFVTALPGYGPRHGAFHPNGKFAYMLSELKSAVDVFAYTGAGKTPSFQRLQTVSALPKKGNDGKAVPSIAAAIRISPDARFIYTSNRGYDSITVFKLLPTGLLEFIDAVPSGGAHPRDFILDPAGNFLLALNQHSDNLVVFKINHRTGLLKKEREYSALSPTGIIFR
jgi:6-phosphogluconolactonase